jgi:hypothetical protein
MSYLSFLIEHFQYMTKLDRKKVKKWNTKYPIGQKVMLDEWIDKTGIQRLDVVTRTKSKARIFKGRKAVIELEIDTKLRALKIVKAL